MLFLRELVIYPLSFQFMILLAKEKKNNFFKNKLSFFTMIDHILRLIVSTFVYDWFSVASQILRLSCNFPKFRFLLPILIQIKKTRIKSMMMLFSDNGFFNNAQDNLILKICELISGNEVRIYMNFIPFPQNCQTHHDHTAHERVSDTHVWHAMASQLTWLSYIEFEHCAFH